jgi:hypothetical protein
VWTVCPVADEEETVYIVAKGFYEIGVNLEGPTIIRLKKKVKKKEFKKARFTYI